MIHPTQEPALYSSNLSKDFYLIDEVINWRIVFRNSQKNSTVYSALKDINLSVPKGKFIGMLGRNGAGKSTLLRVLSGVYPATKGIVRANGKISALFEYGGLGNNRLTGNRYADRYLEIYGIPKSKREDYISNIKVFSELGEYFFNPLYTYSTGMSARLFFSVATELQHEIYLVDELLSVGDEYFQAKCWKRLKERFACGSSGILVTHDWSAILKLCEQSYILDKGMIVANGNSAQMVHQYLNMPSPTKKYAEFIPQSTYEAHSDEDYTLTFKINLKKQARLMINYSIEVFRAGFGWEILLLNSDYIPLDLQVGINEAEIHIPRLPLTPGEYYLNLFLNSAELPLEDLDARSWTYGNALKLIVHGNLSAGIAKLPWNFQVDVLS
ncbi:MAG: ATP-binding cassette domain-containing protein [Gammaproteobacteria bacterium]|jgi:lipopolysaccharide transport system ATP-binding protein|nr:ATP-binding cassette domain-containing protein [Gammaproteobacteria bacterium]